MEQAELIAEFNKNCKLPFNEYLFKRTNDELVKQLININYSLERNGQFVFKVMNWRIITDYFQIQEIMKDYENSLKKGKNKKKLNPYEFINLKDTDFILLITDFYIKIKDVEKVIPIILCVPIYTNCYYYRISGNYYLPILQITDSSVYNSTTAKSATSDSVIHKTMLMAMKMYRNNYTLKTTQEEEIQTTYYSLTSFSKTFSVYKYMLARFGYYQTLKFMNFEFIKLSTTDPNYDDYYTLKSGKIFISVPKELYDNCLPLQSFIVTLYMAFNNKLTKFDKVFTQDYWLEMLGGEYGRYSVQKGLSLLESVEGIYDIDTMNGIHLDMEYKGSIYRILRWMITEFSQLMARDNLDISLKRIKLESYIASFYSMKFSSIIHKFGEVGTNLDMDLAEKYLRGMKPSFLIDQMVVSKFINYQSNVNDLDTFDILKFTMAPLPGLGEKDKKRSSLPTPFKQMHPSHMGRIDPNSSPKSSPGSGTLTPFCEFYGGSSNSFSDFKEEVTYEKEYQRLINKYKKSHGIKNVLSVRKQFMKDDIMHQVVYTPEQEVQLKQVADMYTGAHKDKMNTKIQIMTRVKRG